MRVFFRIIDALCVALMFFELGLVSIWLIVMLGGAPATVVFGVVYSLPLVFVLWLFAVFLVAAFLALREKWSVR